MIRNRRLQYRSRSRVPALVLILVFAAFLRLHGLGKYAFTPDDGWETAIASGSFFDSFYYNFYYFTQPPLGTLWAWMIERVSVDEMWLRTIPFIPGFLLIIAFYKLGRKIAGQAMGLWMAFFSAFGYAPIILSQHISIDSLLLLALVLMLANLVNYRKEKEHKYLVYYFIFAFFAAATSYISALYISAIALVGAITILVEEPRQMGKFRKFFAWCFMHLALILPVIIYFKLQEPSRFMPPLMEGDPAAYPMTFSLLIARLREMFAYLFIGPYEIIEVLFLVKVMCVIGIGFLIKDKKYKTLSVIGLILLLQFLLIYLNAYPLANNRYSFFLLPIILAVSGYPVARIISLIKFEQLFPYIIIMCSMSIASYIKDNNFYRDSFAEFPTTKEEKAKMLGELKEKAPQGRVIIDTYNAFLFLSHERIINQEKHGSVYWVRSEGLQFFYPFQKKANTYSYDSPAAFRNFIAEYVDILAKEGQRPESVCYLNDNPLWPMPMSRIYEGIKPFAAVNYSSRAGFFFCASLAELNRYFAAWNIEKLTLPGK